jgi:hypothetical protein
MREGDAGRAAVPDLGTVEALCRLQLAARRLGCTIRVPGASAELRDLIALVGLDELLLDRQGGQLEEREEARLEERVDPADPPACKLDHLDAEGLAPGDSGRGSVQPEGR